MTGLRRVWPLVAVLGCRGVAAVETRAPAAPVVAEPPPRTPYAGSWLPTPPQQGAAWRRPASDAGLPEALVSATAPLFAAGVADPRGLEYRAVTLDVGNVHGVARVETHAWVLPGAGPRFAVTWSGLVHPVVAVGAPADVATDIAAAVRADAEERAAFARDRPGDRFRRYDDAAAAHAAVAHATLLPIKATLLLRLGEVALARAVWTAWTAGMQADVNDDELHLRDPLLLLAGDWAWYLFDRAVCAHMHADDRLALADARALSGLREHLTAAVAGRGVFTAERAGEAYLYFLASVPALLADQERRAGPAPAPAAERVALKIAELEQVDARQYSQPGGVPLAGDARVYALVGEGDAAVEPLLAALTDDPRLTRAVGFHRDFRPGRELVTVRQAAYVALLGILGTTAFEHSSAALDTDAGRREVAAELRAYWLKWRGVSPVDRRFRTLADDAASVDQWIEAAHELTRPNEVWTVHAGVAHTRRRPKQALAELRRRTAPSLTELLVRRVDELAARPAVNGAYDPLTSACRLAKVLAAWDASGGLAGLTRLWRRARDELMVKESWYEAKRCLGALTTARIAGGDRGALAEYGAWISAQSGPRYDSLNAELLAPLWRNAGRPAAERAAARMFGEGGAGWGRPGTQAFGELLELPMVRLRAVRELMLRALADCRTIGSLQVHEGGGLSYKFADSSYQAAQSDEPDPREPPTGTTLPLRLCDYVAWQLSERYALPPFKPYWPEAERARGIGGVAAWVRTRAHAVKE